MDLVAFQSTLDNLSFGILFLTMLVYWLGAAFPQLTGLATLGTTGMAIANLSIAGLLGARWMEAGYFPISNLYESLFFLAWGVTAMHLVAEWIGRNRLVGAFTAPIAMGITAFAALTLPSEMQHSAPLVPALKSNWLMMHVSVMMLSYATLMVGSALAIAFLFVTWGKEVHLKGSSIGTGGFRDRTSLKRPAPEMGNEMANPQIGTSILAAGATTAVLEKPVTAKKTTDLSLQRLNLAETLDNLSYRIIGLGFPLLTIGIIAGAVWANSAWGAPWSWDPKETWSLITWLVYAAYLHARITRGWQGRRPAILAASGLVVVWVCYLGVNLLGKGLHSYGWFF
ncbi:c-type cytochrome biogenesis protein CcsB [Lyngbya confervoides]|uniref:Cytochrome c biogenesis protein CcsA n=1 Tax=Lyngbya confervoides BDU141951 TaxID=1574623 RepID=A0ABD4T786_9CYAN|nr:c-type cytochrome biogenesis protein CcsB [Lyngbya confervoides]MCM1984338.1 c-type cytochrome biogenesis protein CcsB [Lyngbya confervoides BDU141951]